VPHFLIEYRQLGSDADRELHRPAHIQHRKAVGNRLPVAGSLLNESGENAGSVILYEAEDDAAATAFARADPMVVHGVFELVSVRPFRVAAIKPV